MGDDPRRFLRSRSAEGRPKGFLRTMDYYSFNFDLQNISQNQPNTQIGGEDDLGTYERYIVEHGTDRLQQFRVVRPSPLVTIGVPAYNVEAFLEHTLDSIGLQTYKNWECIIVDDFSTDGTLGIIKKKIREDRRFKIVSHRANGGLSQSRNSVLRCAKGELICFVDSDDVLMNSSVANRVRAIIDNNNPRLAGSYSASRSIAEDCKNTPKPDNVKGMKVVDFITASAMVPFNANQPMFRTSVLRHMAGFDENLKQAEDWEFWMRILRHGFYFVPTHVRDVTYRVRSESMVRRAPSTHLEAGLEIFSSCHRPLAKSQRFEGTPCCLHKPWIEYKKQLDISRRVLEFAGMSFACGEEGTTVVDRITEFLPDFESIISSHRDIAQCVESGVRRQLNLKPGQPGGDYAIRGIVAQCTTQFHQEIAGDEESGTSDPSADLGFGPAPGWQREVDVLFFSHKDYHVWSFSLILEALDEAGLSYAFVELSATSRDEGAVRVLREMGLPSVSYNQFVLGHFRPRAIVCMNDWDPIVRRVVKAANHLGIMTIAVVEGVQDYLDVDVGRKRDPYRTVKNVILPGRFDQRYFPDYGARALVGGVPRIDELLREAPNLPERPLVVINSNFTYNVLTDCRDSWVRDAVSACKKCGYDYVISVHPAERGDFSNYNVTELSMYDAIRGASVFVSRFGSGILESLALGTPSVYFNPHGEKVDKFHSPEGAFAVANSVRTLVAGLESSVAQPERYLQYAESYLEEHCGTNRAHIGEATVRTGQALVTAVLGAETVAPEKRARLRLLLLSQEQALLPDNRDVPKEPTVTPVSVKAPKRAAVKTAIEAGTVLFAERRGWIRKYRKLRRDPQAFLADSHFRPMRALRAVLDRE